MIEDSETLSGGYISIIDNDERLKINGKRCVRLTIDISPDDYRKFDLGDLVVVRNITKLVGEF